MAADDSAQAHELEANRLRARLAATTDQLRTNLRPAHLADEVAKGIGLNDVSAASVVDAVTKKYPMGAALIGIAVSAWAFSKFRKSGANGGASGVMASLRETSNSLGRSATDAFRARAESKRQEFVGVAKSHIEAGVSNLADTIEKKLEGAIDIVPSGSSARPLVESAMKVLLAAALEGLIAKA
jgi:hypothetical protein